MLIKFLILILLHGIAVAEKVTIDDLKNRDYLDDYLSNVLLGYQIIDDTKKNAYRYTGNELDCKNCHLKHGTKENAIPLNVSGMYPKWRNKNGKRNGIGLRIRECFVFSMDGIMPPEDSPEVMAVAAYINHLSEGQIIGEKPEGRGVPVLPDTGFSANPSGGKVIYENKCIGCHTKDGEGKGEIPPLWGLGSYNKGAGFFNNEKISGWIYANMPPGNEFSLSVQDAKDVGAYINNQIRPADPRVSVWMKIIEDIIGLFR